MTKTENLHPEVSPSDRKINAGPRDTTLVIGSSRTVYENNKVFIGGEQVDQVGNPVAFIPSTDYQLYEQPKNAISPKPENG